MDNKNINKKVLEIFEIILEEKELAEDNNLLTIPIDRFEIHNNLLRKILTKLAEEEILELPNMAKALHNESVKNPDVDFDLNYRDYVTNFILIKPNYKKIIEYRQSILRRSKKEDSINRLPKIENLKWEEVTIKFVDGHNVKILIRNKIYKKNFKEMGFEDSKTGRPNKQWLLLTLLAEKHGSIVWGDEETTEKIKKKKQLLSDGLKNFFQVNNDPFHKYKNDTGYEIKIEMFPESDKYLGKISKDNDDDLEIKKYLDEEAPSIYEPPGYN